MDNVSNLIPSHTRQWYYAAVVLRGSGITRQWYYAVVVT
jgi:hypothetical protein